MATSLRTLPIYEVAAELIAGIASTGRIVLAAPTGSGKSTQVPQILLDQAGIEGEIVVLQPRRLAARLLAKRVAFERGVKLGDEVGYQIRFENIVSASTFSKIDTTKTIKLGTISAVNQTEWKQHAKWLPLQPPLSHSDRS